MEVLEELSHLLLMDSKYLFFSLFLSLFLFSLSLSGAAGAILQQAGSGYHAECQQFVQSHGPLKVGECFTTQSYGLKPPVKCVIHVAGPQCHAGTIQPSQDQVSQYVATLQAILQEASRLNLRSISLPLISSGGFGFPIGAGSQITLEVLSNFVGKTKSSLRLIRVVTMDQAVYSQLQHIFQQMKDFIPC
jgi:O-acetyl-ADP-ribose deacetylase (regulator of RNase III)